jgi:hypothetical protein
VVSGRDDYTLKNISTVVEVSVSLPGTNAAGERLFSLVNALWTDERNRLEVPTVKLIVLVTHHSRNYKCPEFHEFLLRNRKILEQIYSSAKYISAPTLPTQLNEVPLTHATASASSDFLFLRIFDLNDFIIIVFVVFRTRNSFCKHFPIFVVNLAGFLPLVANKMSTHTSANAPPPLHGEK